MNVFFWTVFAVTALLVVAWALDRSGDPATRGLGTFYAVIGLGCLGLGLLVFLVSKGTVPRLVAGLAASLPLVFLAVTSLSARYGYLVDRHLKSSGHTFGTAAGRGLGEAIERNDLSRIRQLVAAGADPNEIGRDDRSPLSFALDRGKLEAARLLLELGADPTRGGGEAGRPPLVEMVNSDSLAPVLETALKRGASPDFVDRWHVPVLDSAIASRARRNVELLVAAGARLDTRDDANQVPSPLSYAVQRRLWSTARFLVERGAPLHEAPGYNGLDAIFANADPPGAADPDREEYLGLVRAMTERGFVPLPRPGSAPR